MQTRGLTPGINDLYIASTALTLKLALVTRNDQDFKRFPGLRVETY
jgi:predicted nucleic acid-binding protein